MLDVEALFLQLGEIEGQYLRNFEGADVFHQMLKEDEA